MIDIIHMLNKSNPLRIGLNQGDYEEMTFLLSLKGILRVAVQRTFLKTDSTT